MPNTFVTREHAKVDRIACAWLIKRFIDRDATILYVPKDKVIDVAAAERGKPFDVPDVELGHHGPECSFDAFVKQYELDDLALAKMARIVRGADTGDDTLTAESPGLLAIASGFHAQWGSRYADDHALLDVQFPLYDALYEFCKAAAN